LVLFFCGAAAAGQNDFEPAGGATLKIFGRRRAAEK